MVAAGEIVDTAHGFVQMRARIYRAVILLDTLCTKKRQYYKAVICRWLTRLWKRVLLLHKTG